MRHGVGVNRGQGQAECNLLPNSIFRRKLDAAGLRVYAADQKYAHALGRQLNYGNESWPHWNDHGDGYVGPGWGEATSGFATTINVAGSNVPLYIVDSSTMPTHIVWLVVEEPAVGEMLGPEEEVRTNEPGLQALLSAVPMPELAKLAFGQVGSTGTDQKAVVYDKATGYMYMFHRIAIFQAGALKGEWKCGYGGRYYAPTWNGIGVFANGGGSASYLSTWAGTISLQDLIEVLRGGRINHMLSMAAVVTGGAAGHVAPAIAGDTRENKAAEYENKAKEKLVNPAHGTVDQVPEGMVVTLPDESHPTDYGIPPANKLETEICRSIIDYGLAVRDSGPSCSIYLEDFHSIKSIYNYAKCWPLAGYEGPGHGNFTEVDAAVKGTGWENPSLIPLMTENLTNTSGVLYKLAQAIGNELKQIEPFAS